MNSGKWDRTRGILKWNRRITSSPSAQPSNCTKICVKLIYIITLENQVYNGGARPSTSHFWLVLQISIKNFWSQPRDQKFWTKMEEKCGGSKIFFKTIKIQLRTFQTQPDLLKSAIATRRTVHLKFKKFLGFSTWKSTSEQDFPCSTEDYTKFRKEIELKISKNLKKISNFKWTVLRVATTDFDKSGCVWKV